MKVLPDLKLPLRDILRSAATLADTTDDILAPAAVLLPPPIRTQVGSLVNRVRQAGKRLVTSPVTEDQIRTAARFVAGSAPDNAAAECCATVIGNAWEHLHDAAGTRRHLISETMLAARLSRMTRGAGQSPAQSGANLIVRLRDSSALWPTASLGGAPTAAERQEVDLALVAVVVWLLTDRPASLREEEVLLDLALALVGAVRADVLAAITDRNLLAPILADTAAHL
ncbi:hypothetical protein EYE42_09780 [Paracoccus subflavus]|uniref:Uncharacterized protein n=1 Tax=Paracoccus subflavus TaxID=2528244 RepID=A0A4Q9FZN5_9RHOB|nr:hypothetical protein [Paracoccus subflavus]TBN39936.1 hypothetical protein EYE42_09780 [Paracoccus subflavus]